MSGTLSLAVTSELPFSQRKERDDPEHEQNKMTDLLNSTKSVLLTSTFTLETGTVGQKHSGFILATT